MSSIIHFYSYTFWDPRHIKQAVDFDSKEGSKDRREPKKDPWILYLGTVRINIPKTKYLHIVIRTHILVGDKELYDDMTVMILKYANTPHSKRRRKHMPAG